MQKLNFPYEPDQVRVSDNVMQVFDAVRKKWLVLTPEEWVRQHLVLYLNREKQCPISLMAVEKALKYNTMSRRSDLVLYGKDTRPLLLAECKAPGIQIAGSVFDQAARYNMTLRVPYLLVTNGIQHFCCRVDFDTEGISFLKEIPSFAEMSGV